MVKKFAAALAVVAGGVALAPTAASAACWGWGCTYYTYGYVPSYQTTYATYNQPVLAKKPDHLRLRVVRAARSIRLQHAGLSPRGVCMAVGQPAGRSLRALMGLSPLKGWSDFLRAPADGRGSLFRRAGSAIPHVRRSDGMPEHETGRKGDAEIN